MSEERVVGVYEAKTQLPKLLDSVEHGEVVTITRHGKPVAKLVPIADEETRAQRRAAIERLIEVGQKNTLGGLKIRDLINEGRKY